MKSTLAALTLLPLCTASARADVVFSDEDFEGGAVGQSADAFIGTDYINTANNLARAGVSANIASDPSPGSGEDPSGQHGLVRGNADKHITLADPMPLVSDGVTSLQISLAVYFNSANNNNRLRLWYSALGDFSDQVEIQIFIPTGTADLPNYEYELGRWYASQMVTIDSADVTFTDTAKIRWAKLGTGMSNRVYLDDVVIIGIGGTAALPFAITAIDYAPDAAPNSTVTLTWRKNGAASYIAKFSSDMTAWDADLDDSVTADRDENPEDADHITVTFPLLGDRENLFFRIEEG